MTPGEHGEAVTSNRDTLAAAAHDHWHGPRRCGRTCVLMARCERQANILLPTVEAMLAQARAEALQETADKWAHGEWANAPRSKDQVQERIANAQFVTDWLRARVDRAALAAVSGTDHDTTLDTVRAEAREQVACEIDTARDALNARIAERDEGSGYQQALMSEAVGLRDAARIARRIAPDDTPERGGDDAA